MSSQNSQQTSQTSKKRKRSSSTSNEKSKKKRNITRQESELISNIYKYHNGDTNLLFKDEKIKKIMEDGGFDVKHITNHIDYLKRKKNLVLNTPNRGNEKRGEIIENLQNVRTENVETVNLAEEEEEEEEVENSETMEPDAPTPTLSPREQNIHEGDKRSLQEGIDSQNNDYETQAQHLTEAQKKRNAKIRMKQKEKLAVIEEIRKQRIQQTENQDYKNALLTGLLQAQQQQTHLMTAILAKIFGVNFEDVINKTNKDKEKDDQM